MACGLNVNLVGVTGDCSNLSGGSFNIEIVGTAPDYSIEWVSPFSNTVSLGAGVTSYDITGLTAGTYNFNVVDSCTEPINSRFFMSVYISSGLCTSITGVTNTVCGLNNGVLSAYTQNDYGSNKYLLYHNTLGYITSGTTNIPNGVSFSELSPGTYYVKVIDNGGCTATTNSVIVQDSTTLDYDFYIVNDSGCNVTTGKIYVTDVVGSPPFTYLWSNGATTSSIENLSVGTYSVTVGDNSGCIVTKSANVVLVDKLGVAGQFVTQPGCFVSDGVVNIQVSGGTPPYYYSGSNNVIDVRFDNVMTWNTLASGQFNYFIQDAGLCSVTGGVNITVPTSFNIVQVAATNSTCGNNQGTIGLSITNGTPPYLYQLTGPMNPPDVNTTLQTYTFTQLTNGEYTLTIKDGSGCSFTDTYTIENIVGFEFDVSTTGTTCGSNNGKVQIDVTGGEGPFIYNINGQTNTTSVKTQPFGNLSVGSYTVSVTDTSVPCTQSSSFYIGESSSLVDFTYNKVNPTFSNNGVIEIFITSGQAPFTIEWSENVNGQTGMLVTGLSAGTYTVKVIDNNGCVKELIIILEGISCSVSYEVYNLCEDDFQNNGELIKKTPLLMLNEGYTDLTLNEENCVLNEAIFEVITIVSGITKSVKFFTGDTLSEAPSESLFATTVRNLLLTYDGIGSVNVNSTTNQITINSDCESTVSLLDVDIIVNMKIHYDISCACSKNCIPYEFISRIDFMDDEYNVPTHQAITAFGSPNCLCDYTSVQNVDNSYNLAIENSNSAAFIRSALDLFFKQSSTYVENLYSGFCDSDVGVSIPDVSYIQGYSYPGNFFQKGRPIKIRGYKNIKASQMEGWYVTTIGSTLSAYTDDIRFIRSVSNVGSLPVTGQPGDVIKVGTVDTSVGYAWDPISSSWSTTFYDEIESEILTQIGQLRFNMLKRKSNMVHSMRPFTWSNNYLLFHSIRRWVFTNTPLIRGNDIVANNGEDLPCGYPQNLNDCGGLDPFCGPNKQDDNDLC